MALTEKLTNIANAIREKGGTTEPLTLDGMVEAIAAITTGGGEGGYDIPEGAFTLKNNISYMFRLGNFWWFLENNKDKIKTENLTSTVQTFYNNAGRTEIPISEYVFSDTGCDCESMFDYCQNVKSLGKLVNFKPNKMNKMFYSCQNLRELPDMTGFDLSLLHNSTIPGTQVFLGCYSLRRIPEDFLKELYGKTNNAYSCIMNQSFTDCLVLEELKGISIQKGTGTISSSSLFSGLNGLFRLKELTFDTNEDGTAMEAKWQKQTLNLGKLMYIGYADTLFNKYQYIYQKNSGITLETRIVDAETYELYKNHPDAWTTEAAYSRYNHDSAVNTINSIPDCSAYLSSSGGTNNTIKFLGESGSATDGGAINTLTEEEIAVAVAKGWTITFE